MKAIRWAAVAATALMSLMDLPVAFSDGTGVPTSIAWLATVVGVVGLVAAAGLAWRQPWGRPAVLAIGVLNLAGAIAALAAGWEGGAIGLVVSLLIVGFGWFAEPSRRAAPAISR
jgi:hypothetical protein